MKYFIALLGALTLNILTAAEHKELKAYPAAKDGMERHVIVLPHKERGDDQNFRVELVAGKTMMTDGVNQTAISLKIERQTLKGWGYSYFDVTGKAAVISTLIGVPEGTKQVEGFVSGTPLLINYNSRLPIVIYAPKGIEVRYRIWRADPKFQKAEISEK